jgi:phage shock protein A
MLRYDLKTRKRCVQIRVILWIFGGRCSNNSKMFLVQVIASKKQIEAKYKQSKEAVAMWQSRAELAVQAGEDELAREALKKRKANEEQSKTWEVQMQQQSQAVDQLLANTRAMENKLTEAKSKKETLKARAASAKSSKEVCSEKSCWISRASNGSKIAFSSLSPKTPNVSQPM